MSWHREILSDGWMLDIRDDGKEWSPAELAVHDVRRKGLCHECGGPIKTALYFRMFTLTNRVWCCRTCAYRKGIIW